MVGGLLPKGPHHRKLGQSLFRPKWTILVSRMLNPVRNKVIVTKMVVWTILVPRPFPISGVLSRDV